MNFDTVVEKTHHIELTQEELQELLADLQMYRETVEKYMPPGTRLKDITLHIIREGREQRGY